MLTAAQYAALKRLIPGRCSVEDDCIFADPTGTYRDIDTLLEDLAQQHDAAQMAAYYQSEQFSVDRRGM